MSVEKIWNQIENQVEETRKDVKKHINGNKSAGTRVRKSSMDLRKLLKDLKTESLKLTKEG